MKPRLRERIGSYQARVRWALSLLDACGIPRPKTAHDWCRTKIPEGTRLGDGVSYYKHGYGIAVRDAAGEVDFDFGSRGEVEGADAWRLQQFAAPQLERFGYVSEDEIKADFDEAVAAGELVYSGYYVAPPPADVNR